MADKKIIAVVGATGLQGGGLVRAIMSQPSSGFTARALTRDVHSDKAKELASLGAEVVAADLHNVDSVKRAFAGAHGAFCVTFFWAHLSPEKEYAEAKGMAEAAKHAGVQHVIWSTLEDTRQWVPINDTRMPTLMGKYKVPHFDAKGEANRVFNDLGLSTTFLLTSFYWDNFIHFGMGPKKGQDGKLALTLPMGDKKLPGIAAGEHLTGAQMAAALTKALEQEVRYNAVTPEAYRNFGFPGADDLGNMFQFKRDFEPIFCGARKLDVSRSLNPALQNFETWLAQNKTRIPLE
jgi:uncharacterized protein YbjT (DUF2867 family)